MNKPIIVKVFPVLFKRTQKSKRERGIAIGDEGDVKIIIDRKFKPVKVPLWNFYPFTGEGCLPINL